MGIALILVFFTVAMQAIDYYERKQLLACKYLITDGGSFQRIEHSKADAEAWSALGFTVTKLH